VNILTISDLHTPSHHPDVFDFLADLRRRYKPHRVVCLGDEIDAHCWSRFPRSPDLPGARDELDQAIAVLKRVYKIFPVVDVCVSNHTIRPYKRASESGLPTAFLKSIKDVLEAPVGWNWHENVRIDDVLYMHGEGFSGQNGAVKAATLYRHKVVMAHIHAWGGVVHLTGLFDRIYGMNAGCLVNLESEAFSYGKHLATKPTLGTGLVLEGVPVFVPM